MIRRLERLVRANNIASLEREAKPSQLSRTVEESLARSPAARTRRGRDVLPHRAGAEHAAAPAALRPAPPRQARLQAHQGRRGHLQVGLGIGWAG